MVAKSLLVGRHRLAVAAFKAWCKTPRCLALHPWYLPFYSRVGWVLDDWAYGQMRDDYKRVREGHRA